MVTFDGSVDRSAIIAKGGLCLNSPGYIFWEAGDPEIVMEGDFSVADLRWLISHVERVNDESRGNADP